MSAKRDALTTLAFATRASNAKVLRLGSFFVCALYCMAILYSHTALHASWCQALEWFTTDSE
jgi:hypothetical protein